MTPTYLDLQSVMHQIPLDVYKHVKARQNELSMSEAADLANAARITCSTFIQVDFDHANSHWVFRYDYRYPGVDSTFRGFRLIRVRETHTQEVS